MNFQDFIIIYLACGAPFGAFYFFNKKDKSTNVLLQSLFITIVWIPYGIKLLHSEVTNRLNEKNNFASEKKLKELQRDFENLLVEKSRKVSLFEFREIIERYKELTLITKENIGIPAKHEKEFYKLNGSKGIEVSSICLNRKNHQKLISHQQYSREDFLSVIKIMLEEKVNENVLFEISGSYVNELNDKKAINEVKKIFNKSQQIDNKKHVKDWEKQPWEIQQLPQSKIKQLPIPISALNMKAQKLKRD